MHMDIRGRDADMEFLEVVLLDMDLFCIKRLLLWRVCALHSFLCVMQNLPSRSSPLEYPQLIVTDTSVIPDGTLIQQWLDANQKASTDMVANNMNSISQVLR
ncbi:hypothetical protein KP509_33G040400 [Ceratopteris richardii]|uniref:Uncharacterized protein n=1 Tax=Ceratopteris richardii TaxID=49495 RepID=A0A8T2QQA0_CERRI|nr:hypothetical protein KP509_1Z267000 [Ceratopteris richardii]KAH7285675.1 hypothetical protein KP509_33G040400 [Ceratopteris richardii]